MTYSSRRNYFVRTPRRRLFFGTFAGVIVMFGGLGRLDNLWLHQPGHPAALPIFLVGLALGLAGFPLVIYLAGRGRRVKYAGFILLAVFFLLMIIGLIGRYTQTVIGPSNLQFASDGVRTALGILMVVGGLYYNPSFRARLQIPVGSPSVWEESRASMGEASESGVADSVPLEWLATAEFGIGLRGYNINAVDRFIEDVVWRSQTGSATAHELRVQEFPLALKGYNTDDVDHALERAAKQLAAD